MNYFAHGLRFLDRPYFLAGTCAPDWLSAMDRSVRLRTRSVSPFADHDDPLIAEFAQGVLQHLADDDWFHATRGFAEVTGELSSRFRAAIGPDHPTPCSFLGHIVTEMLLDAELMRRHPGVIDRYYDALETVDPGRIESAVNLCAARGQTDRLREFVPLFLSERFLPDYLESSGLWRRLNQVLRRVRLTPLPDSAAGVLDACNRIVVERFDELLPDSRFVRT